MKKEEEMSANRRIKSKRGVLNSTLIYWLIAVVVLAIIIIFSVFLKDKLFALGDYIKNLFRSG